MRVALVHDWLTGMRGGEKVLEELLHLYPEAEIFTLFHDPGEVSETIEARPIHTSLLDKIPGVRRRYRYFLPLYPWAIRGFDLSGFDLVVSSSHCAAKAVSVPYSTPHVCYCHTPMRYIWDQYDAYFAKGRAGLVTRAAMSALVRPLQRWDEEAARHVDHYVANSNHIRERIRLYYGREASVVHPPVDLDRFAPTSKVRGDYYLTLGALVPYKRLDLAVEAFNRMGKALRVVGGGVELDRLTALAGETVTVEGPVPDDVVVDRLSNCRAVILPGVEDFGISVVEALASGAPVIALGEGGARDTVRDTADSNANGVFFPAPTVDALIEAVGRFESLNFDAQMVARSAAGFGRADFREGMMAEIEATLSAWPGRPDGTPVTRGTVGSRQRK